MTYDSQDKRLKYELDLEQLSLVNRNQAERLSALISQHPSQSVLELYEQHLQ